MTGALASRLWLGPVPAWIVLRSAAKRSRRSAVKSMRSASSNPSSLSPNIRSASLIRNPESLARIGFTPCLVHQLCPFKGQKDPTMGQNARLMGQLLTRQPERCRCGRMLARPKILKAARLLLNLTQEQVGEAAGLSDKTVKRMESGAAKVTIDVLEAVQRVYERQGIRFLQETDDEGEGLRLPKNLK
ncbi:helix-turn-helix transcriptional regulator [Microvirga tunisiensis]|uniref:Helix-turn-helix transcriptional regulator n=2 Tax=Microvirga tunisiensis TaxID=2108360 RepID=A0A5N7MQX4_9HYPH|nr:helix-turn-helix transcriptional regulator [Microvirga tunisiensis]MPR29405.1 helix-turn-helix transcriptional regulator [Microvirga tunisiensis]